MLRVGRNQAKGFAEHAFVELNGNQAACGVALVGAMPCGFELNDELPRNIACNIGIAGQGKGLDVARFAHLIIGFLEEAAGGFNQINRRALRV